MHLLAALVLAATSVSGIVLSDRAPLPGTTVTLSAGDSKTAVTDIEGAYRFEAVEPDEYTLRFELTGLTPIERRIKVTPDGGNVQPVANMVIDMPSETFSCFSHPPCLSWGEPADIWDHPSCSDYDLDTALLDGVERGDRSAIALVEQRYTNANTFAQKHRLAAGLLRRAPDDRAYWNELYEHARNAVRFGGNTPAFEEWCSARQLDAEQYWWIGVMALEPVGLDPRGRQLLRDCLQIKDPYILQQAVMTFAQQRDESMLPEIEQALEANPDDAEAIAMHLCFYGSAAADQLAARFVTDFEEYERWRAPRDED